MATRSFWFCNSSGGDCPTHELGKFVGLVQTPTSRVRPSLRPQFINWLKVADVVEQVLNDVGRDAREAAGGCDSIWIECHRNSPFVPADGGRRKIRSQSWTPWMCWGSQVDKQYLGHPAINSKGKFRNVTGSRKTKSKETLIPGSRVRRGRGSQMALTTSPSSKLNRNRVDLSTPELARHWRKFFGKTEEEIAAAIAKVGNNVETVKKELVNSDSQYLMALDRTHKIRLRSRLAMNRKSDS